MVAATAGSPGLGLRALLCCVFEKDEGPIILCSDPANAVAEQFKPLGRYLLPETFVKGRGVSIVLDDNVVLGAPVYIEDTQYDRNCFQFNICMVISSRIDAEPHRDLAQHLAMSFHALEVELKLLSRSEEVPHVRSILASLRSQLNASEECFVRVADSHCIAFRVRRLPPALAPPPFLSQVPVPLVDLARLLDLKPRPSGDPPKDEPPDRAYVAAEARHVRQPSLPFEPDVTLLALAPLVDGVRSVHDLVEASALGDERVLLCLQHLLHFGLVAVIDAIGPESRYSLTPEFHAAFEQCEVGAEAVTYVTAGRRRGGLGSELLAEVQALYAAMNGWDQTLGEFQQEHADELHENMISLRHFVTFGLLRGFLERIDQTLSQEEERELQALRSMTIRRKQELKEQGMDAVQVNKEPKIKALVARMNALKAKESKPSRWGSER